MSFLFRKPITNFQIKRYSLPFYAYNEQDHRKSAKLWYYLTLATMPICGFFYYVAHKRHHDEIIKHGREGPPMPEYEFRQYTKEFAWGDGKTSFFDNLFKGLREKWVDQVITEHEKHSDHKNH